MENKKLPILGITCGDLNGVGMELIIRMFSNDYIYKYCTPVLYCNPKPIAFLKKSYKQHEFKYHVIDEAKNAKPGQMNLVVSSDSEFRVELGKQSKDSGAEALKSLNKAMEDAKRGTLDAIVTAPLDKSTVAESHEGFTGHTGFIANELGSDDYCMILYADNFRVALVTEHVSVDKVATTLTSELIENKINAVHKSLMEDFLITRPRIAVLGLNPHAGDGGVIGKEEIEVINPAIKKMFETGKLVFGPYPADSYFSGRNMHNFDAVIAMYHDQGLIPFKSVAFHDGINFTAGLSLIRTSPDHGTAYDIAGKNEASITSFQAAVHEAILLHNNRLQHIEDYNNPLSFGELKRERFRINF